MRYCNAELTQEYPSRINAEVKLVQRSKGVPARRSVQRRTNVPTGVNAMKKILVASLALFATASVASAETVRLGTAGAYMPWNGLDDNNEVIGF